MYPNWLFKHMKCQYSRGSFCNSECFVQLWTSTLIYSRAVNWVIWKVWPIMNVCGVLWANKFTTILQNRKNRLGANKTKLYYVYCVHCQWISTLWLLSSVYPDLMNMYLISCYNSVKWHWSMSENCDWDCYWFIIMFAFHTRNTAVYSCIKA